MAHPRPKPTHLKIIQGNAGQKPLNYTEPVPPDETPDRPQGLCGVAAEKWDFYAPKLDKMGIFSIIDADSFVDFCHVCAEIDLLEFELDELGGPVYETITREGCHVFRLRPQQPILEAARNRKFKLLIEFGLTPAARSRIKVPNGKNAETIGKKYFGT